MNAALRVADGESWELRTRHTRGDVDPRKRNGDCNRQDCHKTICNTLWTTCCRKQKSSCVILLHRSKRILKNADNVFVLCEVVSRLCTFGSWECNHFVNFILLSVLPNRQQLWFVMLQRETSSNYGSMIIFMHWKVVTSCHVIKYLFIYFTNHHFFKRFDKITVLYLFVSCIHKCHYVKYVHRHQQSVYSFSIF